MRRQLEKLTTKRSTKSERRFAEILKKFHIPFQTKVLINGREIDFLIREYAIDIDNHEQDTLKNEMLVRNGFTPIHFSNNEIKKINVNKNEITRWFGKQ